MRKRKSRRIRGGNQPCMRDETAVNGERVLGERTSLLPASPSTLDHNSRAGLRTDRWT